MKNRGQSYEDPDGNNAERRGAKKASDYLFLAPFSLSHIALPRRMDQNISWLSLFHSAAAKTQIGHTSDLLPALGSAHHHINAPTTASAAYKPRVPGRSFAPRNQSSGCTLRSNTVMSLATSSTNTNRTTPRLTFATAIPNAPPCDASTLNWVTNLPFLVNSTISLG
jgi:hypothetical protein